MVNSDECGDVDMRDVVNRMTQEEIGIFMRLHLLNRHQKKQQQQQQQQQQLDDDDINDDVNSKKKEVEVKVQPSSLPFESAVDMGKSNSLGIDDWIISTLDGDICSGETIDHRCNHLAYAVSGGLYPAPVNRQQPKSGTSTVSITGPSETSFNVRLGQTNYGDDDFWNVFNDKKWGEEASFLALNQLINGNDFVDIGAWIGPYSLTAATKARHVYSFEPDPVAYSNLIDNILVNPNLKRIITPLNLCLWDNSSMIPMLSYEKKGDSMSSIIRAELNNINNNNNNNNNSNSNYNSELAFSAWCVDADEFFVFKDVNRLAEVGLIKIDVEGGEIRLLPKLGNTFRKLIRADKSISLPPILIELHPFMFRNTMQMSVYSDIIVGALSDIYPFVYFPAKNPQPNIAPVSYDQVRIAIIENGQNMQFSIIVSQEWIYI